MTHRFPLTLIWPADAKVAVPEGRWRRLASGRIEATYESRRELEVCLWFAEFEDRQMELKAA